MKFQVGDKVLVMLTNEEGEVLEVLSEKMVLVEVRGVKFPAYTDQLDFPYFKRFSSKKMFEEEKKPKTFIDEVPKEKKKPVQKVVDGVWITLIPVFHADEFGDDIVDTLKVHLVNRTAENYNFVYTLQYSGDPDFQLSNQVHAFEDFYLNDLPFENVNDSPAFNFEFRLSKPDKKKEDFYESVVKLKPRQVFSRIEELKSKGEATFSYKLFDQFPDKKAVDDDFVDLGRLAAAGFKVYSANQARQHLDPASYEVDLHIEKITHEHGRMNNFEKLTLQLQTLEKKLDLSVAHHQSSMVVIHGVGSGKLRDEIHEILRMRRDVKSFYNRYHPKYGYGATEVFFK